jgi:hypothetical protein
MVIYDAAARVPIKDMMLNINGSVNPGPPTRNITLVINAKIANDPTKFAIYLMSSSSIRFSLMRRALKIT